MIMIDGSAGGGQMLRTALALSHIEHKPFEMKNIRAERPQPGLKMQHLHCIKAFMELYDTKVEDAHLGSSSIRVFPGKRKKSKVSIDMKTAGSITLFLQSLMPALILDKKKSVIEVIGGTDVKWSMQYDYFAQVIIPYMRNAASIDISLHKRGYYPKGGGKVIVKIKPHTPRPLYIKRESLVMVRGVAHSSVPEYANRLYRGAKSVLKTTNRIEINTVTSDSDGWGMTLYAYFSDNEDNDPQNRSVLGADIIGEGNPEKEGADVARKLQQVIKEGDPHLEDNLILLHYLLGGNFVPTIETNHTVTNKYVISKFSNL